MIDYKMPYDFILPYEGGDIFKELRAVNRHIFVEESTKIDGFRTEVRQRRHKSDVPKAFY